MRWVKSKALSMIIIVVCAIFSISLLAPQTEAAQQVCCEKTKSGEYCAMGTSADCDSRFNSASVTSCSQASFCKPVCCIDNSAGTCFANVPFSTCYNTPNATYDTNVPSCDARVVSACRLGCCNLGGAYSLKTETQCKAEVEKNPAYYTNQQYFDSSITNEYDCLQKGRAKEEGCCVSNDGTCSFTSLDQCSTSSKTISKTGDPGFYKNAYCSDKSLKCNCVSHSRKGCVENSDDVYWFDSCENKEEVAEDCDLDSKLTVCGLKGNDYACLTANCINPKKYKTSPNTNVSLRKHSESWCVYESGAGNFLDRPGTKHYRATCSNGVETLEQCRDFREEICVESTVGSSDLGNFTEAQCLYNDIYDSPINERISTVPLGFKFWQGASKYSPRRTGSDVCGQANVQCTVTWIKERRGENWDCKGNCQCETQEWIDQVANYCKSFGDCGADQNILGKRTHDGLVVEWIGNAAGERPNHVSEATWQNWNKYGAFGGIRSLSQAITEFRVRDTELKRNEQYGGEYATYTAVGGVVAGIVTYGILYLLGYGAVTLAGGVAAAATATTAAALSAATVIGIAVAVVILVVAAGLAIYYTGGNARQKIVNVYCNPWVAPKGGADCSKCNDDPLGCTEYKCKSLGQACGLINEGTDDQKCVDIHPNDVNSPIITPWQETLTKGYSIFKLPNGFEIQPKVKPFTRITFGFKTNEPAQCKLSTEHTKSIGEMPHFFANNPLYLTEHNTSLSLPNGKDYTYYIRCQDAKGNANSAEYAIKLSTEVGADFTPAIIEATSIEKGASIASSASNGTLIAFLNEPAQCKWSTTDKSYDTMENLFVCSTDVYEDQTFYNLYECGTFLSPIAQGKESTFYFKCKDNSGNINQESYIFSVRRSAPLTLAVSTTPKLEGNKLPSQSFKIEALTAAGSEDGNSQCRFSQGTITNYDSMIDFFETGSNKHIQELQLKEGKYQLNIACRDSALNEVKQKLQFTVEEDKTPPKLTQVYKQAGTVYFNLNELAKCEYAESTFTYGLGTPLSSTYLDSFAIQQPAKEYWIACQDIYENTLGPLHIVP